MSTLSGLLNPNYQPPAGATMNEWGYYVDPNGDLSPGQNTPGSNQFTPVDSEGTWNSQYIPNQYIDPLWSMSNTGSTAGLGIQGAPNNPVAAAAPPPTTGGGSSGGGGGSSFGGGALTAPWAGRFLPPTPPTAGLPDTPHYTAPEFNAPQYQKPDAYKLPTLDEARNDPGFQFGLGESLRAMEQSAAARGALNTGGTLKDLSNYARSAADQQYNQVNSRNQGIYGLNVQTQNVQPYQFAMDAALANFAPKMAEFNANVGAGNLGYSTTAAYNQRSNEDAYNHAWDQYLQGYNEYRNQKLDTTGQLATYYGLQ